MASTVARAYNEGRSGGRAPSGVQGAKPLVRESGGEAPLKLKHFWVLDVQWKPQIWPLVEKKLERQKIKKMCYLCKKTWLATKLGAWNKNRRAVPSAPGLNRHCPDLVVG